MTPIPRFLDQQTNTPYEIVLACTACGWSIVKDRITRNWHQCRLCRSKLTTGRINYPSSKETQE